MIVSVTSNGLRNITGSIDLLNKTSTWSLKQNKERLDYGSVVGLSVYHALDAMAQHCK